MRKEILYSALCSLVFVVAACGRNDTPEDVYARFRFADSEISIYEDYITTVSLEIRTDSHSGWSFYPMTQNPLEILLTSSDSKSLWVEQDGNVYAMAPGRFWVFAESKLSGQRDSIYVTVSERTLTDDEKAFRSASWGWECSDSGIKYGTASINMFNSAQTISVVEYSQERIRTSLLYNPGSNCTTTDAAAAVSGSEAALNGGYFTGSLTAANQLSMDGSIITMGSEDERGYRCNGMLLLTQDGKVEFARYQTSQITYWTGKYSATMEAGPLLLMKGSKCTLYNNDFENARHPRTMIGTTPDGIVKMVVVDGRFSGKAAGATIPEMQKIAKYLKLSSAINLDGGGSSTIWTREKGVLNYPCDNAKWDHAGTRAVPTVIIAKR